MTITDRGITPSPPSIEIDGVLYRQCGEGRKQRRAGAIECGRILPIDQFVVNTAYSDGHGLICRECGDKQNARYAGRAATAIVPIKVYDDVPIGGNGVCRGVSIAIDGIDTPHLVVIEACRYWGLDGQAQTNRIREDPTLSAGLLVVKLTTSQGAVPAYALRYDLVPQWFNGIETAKMRNRERATQLAAYQRTCADVLADYFYGTKTAPPPPAQRIEPDKMIVGNDAPMLRYLETALTPIYQRLGILDAIPRIDAAAQSAALDARAVATALAGVDQIRIKQVIRAQLYIFRLLPDSPYFSISIRKFKAPPAPGEHIIAIGRTGPDGDVHELRIADYGGKFPFQPNDYELLAVIQTDRSEDSERVLLGNPLSGCVRFVLANGRTSQTFLRANDQGLRAYRAFASGYYSHEVLRDMMINADQLRLF